MLSMKNVVLCFALLSASFSFAQAKTDSWTGDSSGGEAASVDSAQPNASANICYSGNHELPLNNEQVLIWENGTKNGYHSRGHVLGTIVEIFKSSSSHKHISVQIGSNPEELIEVIYNESFGPLPQLSAGMEIEACGDYITSTAAAGRNQASPDHAVIHWVHGSTSSHDAGFVVINGKLYGDK